MNAAGILILDKRAGISSAKAIAEVQRSLGIEKIGHAGTLDPFATGILVCLLNGATRVASYAVAGNKRYSGIMHFGRTTRSDDSTGETLSESPLEIDRELLVALVPKYLGEIQQVPPQVSAIKVAGERAYERARSGKTTELLPRTVNILRFDLEVVAAQRVRYLIECSPGTYIRSLARDLGQDLGIGGCVESLRREYSAPFPIANAKILEELTLKDILPWTSLFPDAPMLEISESEAESVLHGDLHVITALGERPEWDLVNKPELQVRPYGSARHGACGLLKAEHGVLSLAVNVLRAL